MSNSIIDKQRQILADHELQAGDSPVPEGVDEAGSGAPPAAPAQGIPGQEPLGIEAPGAAQVAPPIASSTPPPVAGTAETEALKQQITVLTGQVQEFQTLYERQRGMVAPLQRKTAEQDRTIADLTRKVEDLGRKAAAPGSEPLPQGHQEAPPAATGADDPNLKEFTELYGDMIPGLKVFIQQAMGPLAQQVQPAIEISAEAARKKVLDAHLTPLYARYPQAGNIIRSPEFAQWVEKQPSFAQEAIVEKVTHPENYPVGHVIAVFDEFQRATTPTPPVVQDSVPSPGEMALDIRRVPTSSTPGGTPQAQPLTQQRLSELRRALTVDSKLYTPEQILGFKAELAQGEVASNAAGYGLAPRLGTLTQQ